MDAPTVQPPNPYVSQPVPSPQPKNYSNILIAILLLVIGILVGMELGEPPLVSNLRTRYLGAKPTPTPLASPKPTAEAGDPTANWQTFTFEPIGHTFKYPIDWTASQCEGGIHLFVQPTQRGGTSCETPPFGVVFIAFDSKPIETGYLKSTDYILEEEQKITTPFGQAIKRAIKRVNEGPGPLNYIEITFKGTNNYYYLISTENPQYKTVIDQILSTFRFTGQSETTTTGHVSGKLCYPAEGIPPGNIIAKNIQTDKLFTQKYPGTAAGGGSTYTFSLPVGIYHIKFQQFQSSSGYYTECAKNPENAVCSQDINHKNIDITVTSNQTTPNIDLCDFYFTQAQEQTLEQSF